MVTAVPPSPVQPHEPLVARPSPAIILPPQPESSLTDSSDTKLCELEETVISASQGLDGPSGHSTPAQRPLFRPTISDSLPVPRERLAENLRAVRDDSPYKCGPQMTPARETRSDNKTLAPSVSTASALTFKTIRDPFTLTKDNLVHFVVTDCILHTAAGRTLADLDLVDSEKLRERGPEKS